jgi:hypothetical protein
MSRFAARVVEPAVVDADVEERSSSRNGWWTEVEDDRRHATTS